MIVKVTPKTYRTIYKVFEIMEKKGQGIPDFSLEINLEEAVKLFSELLQEGSNNEILFELQNKKENPKKESETLISKQREKGRNSNGRKSMTQDKIIELLQSSGTSTISQMAEKTQLSKNTIRIACNRLIEKGIIEKTERGKYELLRKGEPKVQKNIEELQEDSEKRQSSEQLEKEELKNSSEDSLKQNENEESDENQNVGLSSKNQEELQLNGIKVQEQANLTEAKWKELFANYIYFEVVDYIFTKTSFTIENLRKKFPMKQKEIVEVIQLALNEGCITETEQDGKYQVEDIFRLYYFLLKTDRPIPFSKILVDFRGNPDVLEQLLRKCLKRRLLMGQKTHGTMCYKAIK